MSAVMLLPTWMSMQSTYYISADMPEKTELYNDLLDILNQMLPNAELTYREGLPNLYCGMFVVILLVFYWISRRFFGSLPFLYRSRIATYSASHARPL